MTNTEYRLKYPIGTKIRYTGKSNGNWWRNGWTGTLVGILNDFPLIYLPKSTFVSSYSTTEYCVTVQTSWSTIERAIQPNQQMLFSFME